MSALIAATLAALLWATGAAQTPTDQPPTPPVPDFAGQPARHVLEVAGPDTLLVELDSRPTRVRLLGVYVPADKAAADAAREFLTRLLVGESVYLESDPLWPQRDDQDRLWAYVYRSSDGLPVHLELVRQGYARVAAGEDFQQRDLLRAYEHLARQNHKGIWAPAARRQVTTEPATQPAATGPPAKSAQGDIVQVYVTPHGRKYHRQDCPHARRGATAVTLEEARRRGYAPCSRCRPPQ